MDKELTKLRLENEKLAAKLGTSRQNLTNKFSRDNFQEKEMIEIAKALGCTYTGTIIIDETGEEL